MRQLLPHICLNLTADLEILNIFHVLVEGKMDGWITVTYCAVTYY